MLLALTTELPIPYAGDLADYLKRLHSAAVPDIAKARPDLSPEQQALLRRCLHAQPARRFRNGDDLAAALQSLP
jgi:serine/threonine-protein kinase